MCYARYRMNDAKIRHGIYICNTSTWYMCSVLNRYMICYLYQLIHVVLCFVLLQAFETCRFFDLFDFSYSWHCLFPYCFWPLNKVAEIVAVRTGTIPISIPYVLETYVRRSHALT